MADKAEDFVQQLRSAGVRVISDMRENYTPGWKYNHWELKVSTPPLPPYPFSPWVPTGTFHLVVISHKDAGINHK